MKTKRQQGESKMNGTENTLQRLTLVAAIMTTASLFAEVVTWSGEEQTVSADTAIEALHVSAATTVTVADGCTLTVDELVGDAPVTKAGNGTLVVKNFSANAQISATAGSVRFAADGPTDTTAFDTDSTHFHIDASVSATRTQSGTTASGQPLVSRLADVRGEGKPFAANNGYNMPWVDSGALNGLDVLDFGSFWYNATGRTDGYGAALIWSASSASVREVLLVYSDAHGVRDQFLLCDDSSTYHYHRGGDGALFNGTYSSASVRNGKIYVDGAEKTAAYVLPDGFHVIRLVQSGVTTASTFAKDRNAARGGICLAEAVVLNANLDAVSSRRLEMRLQQKWLPEARTLASLTLAGAANLTVDAGVKFRVQGGTLDPNATITGEGEALFEVSSDLYSYPAKSIVKVTGNQRPIQATAARRIRVEQGRLHIITSAAKLTPALHLDAAQSSSFTMEYVDDVRYWDDVRGNGVNRAKQETLNQRPRLTAGAQNGLPVVDCGDLYLSPSRWLEDNAPQWMQMAAEVSGIRDVFLVVADTDDARQYCIEKNWTGQFLLCHNTAYDFHRTGLSLLLDHSYGCGKDAGTTTALDGASCAKAAVLPEGFHLVRISPQNAVKFNQLCKERSGYSCMGGLKYGEILAYTGAKLSDAEAADVSSYLLNKWGLPNANGKGVAYESLEVLAGATLVVPKLSTTAELLGAGTVDSDLALADGFSLKVTAGSPLAVTGKLTLPKTGTIDIAGVGDCQPNDVITLVGADSVSAPADAVWTTKGTLEKPTWEIRPFVDAEGLKARIVQPGLSIFVK